MEQKYIKGIFVVSILVNAFLCGVLISGHAPQDRDPFMVRGGDRDGGRMHGPPEKMIFERIEEQSKTISSGGQKKVADILQEYEGAFTSDSRDDIKDVFTEIHQTITAPQFDKAKLKSLHDKIRQRDAKQKNVISDMILDIASTLSDEDRIKLFKDLLPPPPPDMEHGRETEK